eukprot:gene8987-biopygen6163
MRAGCVPEACRTHTARPGLPGAGEIILNDIQDNFSSPSVEARNTRCISCVPGRRPPAGPATRAEPLCRAGRMHAVDRVHPADFWGIP